MFPVFISHLLYGLCAKIFIMNQYISKSYTTSKNTIEQLYTERGQLQCQLLLVLRRMTRVTVITRMTEMTGVAGMTRITKL